MTRHASALGFCCGGMRAGFNPAHAADHVPASRKQAETGFN